MSSRLHYFGSQGLNIAAQTCLLTVGYGYVSHCLLGATWREIVIEHGLLVALIAAGRTCYYCYNLFCLSSGSSSVGQSSDFMSSNSRKVTTLATLGLSFVLISLTNRLGIISIAYFLVGYTTTALLSDFASPLTNRFGIGSDFECHDIIMNNNSSGNNYGISSSSNNDRNSSMNNNNNVNGFPTLNDLNSTSEMKLKRSKAQVKLSIYVFIFTTLTIGVLYNDNKLGM